MSGELWLFIGLMVGTSFGVFVAGLCKAASDPDDQHERMPSNTFDE